MFAPPATTSPPARRATPQLSRSSSASTLSAVPTTPPNAPIELPLLPSKPHVCRDLTGAAVNGPIKALLAPALSQLDRRLRIAGLLATPDKGCEMYADMTARACQSAGVDFQRLDLRSASSSTEDGRFAAVLSAIKALNDDDSVDGLLVYLPLFGARRDAELRAAISPRIDVEGVSPASLAQSYATPPPPLEAVFRDPGPAMATAYPYPCTAAAVLRTLSHASVPASGTVTIINRSETVGRPLAAMLANCGATVYSVDVTGVQLWQTISSGLSIEDIDTPLPLLLAQSDAVVSAVPGSYTVPTQSLKMGTVCIDLSAEGNFAPNVRERAGVFAPRIGAVTISMLMCNALVLRRRAESGEGSVRWSGSDVA
ncbi:hypothetical protein A1Q2_00463 [Trichosporon asahii var. asahii CBS 8904]|uniref:Methylenetetrahydrofolate dehydrogenase (NAD+) n=1 Tax=Trichosporon asahii var. asahii (strain CBS 8904) TaxID=1220162 RepID=K1W8V2_TRIAC|nr:hypothetical protein A1Q2_00463 [Trichosporon asahii var. asahii CBS 8904]